MQQRKLAVRISDSRWQYQRRIAGRFSEGTENGDNGSEELQLQQENDNVENVAEPDNNKADEGAGQAQADFYR